MAESTEVVNEKYIHNIYEQGQSVATTTHGEEYRKDCPTCVKFNDILIMIENGTVKENSVDFN